MKRQHYTLNADVFVVNWLYADYGTRAQIPSTIIESISSLLTPRNSDYPYNEPVCEMKLHTACQLETDSIDKPISNINVFRF